MNLLDKSTAVILSAEYFYLERPFWATASDEQEGAIVFERRLDTRLFLCTHSSHVHMTGQFTEVSL